MKMGDKLSAVLAFIHIEGMLYGLGTFIGMETLRDRVIVMIRESW